MLCNSSTPHPRSRMFPLFFYSGQGLSGHQFSYVQKDEIQVLIGEEAFQIVEWDKVQINNKLKGFDFLLSSISFVLQTTSMISYNNYLYISRRKKNGSNNFKAFKEC